MKTFIFAAAMTSAAFASAAYAEDGDKACTDVPKADWQSEDALKAKGAEMGMDVRGVKVEGQCYELYAINADGKKMELLFNPVTLEQMKSEQEDD